MHRGKNTSFRIRGSEKILEYDRNKILDSVALQDHYSKILKMPKMPLGRRQLPLYSVRKVQTQRIQEEKISAAQEYKQIQCNAKSKTDTNIGHHRVKPGGTQYTNKENIDKDLNYTDVMNNKVDTLNQAEDLKREQKILTYNRNLTLAQKRGLVKKPNMPLTPHEWSNVIKVANQRISSEATCSIC
jgi:hypothetical protein